MGEEKEKITPETLLTEMRERLPKRLVKALEEYLKPREPEIPTITPEVWRDKVTEHLLECPTCYADIFKRVYSSSDYLCKDCGFPIRGVKQFEFCPECRGEGLRKRKKRKR